MSQQFSLQSGGRSDGLGTGSVAGLDFFQPSVKNVLMPSGKNTRSLVMRLLPAFPNENQMSPHDQAFPISAVPFRVGRPSDPDCPQDEEGGPEFTGWYQRVYGYPFFGRSKRGFLSPRTLGMAAGQFDTRCPLESIRNVCRSNPRDPSWARFVNDDDELGGTTLQYDPQLILFNAIWSSDGKPWEQGVSILKKSGLQAIKQQMSAVTPHGCQPINPNWPEYLLGDPTCPQYGLWGKVYKIQFGTIQTNSIVFATQQQLQNGRGLLEQMNPQLVTADTLRNRHVLSSSDTLKILSKEEIIQLLLDDGIFPLELIREACGGYADIPTHHQPSFAAASTAPQAQGQAHYAPQGQTHQYGAPEQDYIPGLPGDPHSQAPAFPSAPPMASIPPPTPQSAAFAPTQVLIAELDGQAWQTTTAELESWLNVHPSRETVARVTVYPADRSAAPVTVVEAKIGPFMVVPGAQAPAAAPLQMSLPFGAPPAAQPFQAPAAPAAQPVSAAPAFQPFQAPAAPAAQPVAAAPAFQPFQAPPAPVVGVAPTQAFTAPPTGSAAMPSAVQGPPMTTAPSPGLPIAPANPGGVTHGAPAPVAAPTFDPQPQPAANVSFGAPGAAGPVSAEELAWLQSVTNVAELPTLEIAKYVALRSRAAQAGQIG